jgi:hypothetical protein
MQVVKAERSKATDGAVVMWKLCANSLIGKFSQSVYKISPNEYLRIKDKNPEFLLEELISLPTDFLLALGAKRSISLGSVFMPDWFGLVTGLARAELAIMLNSVDPYYCHTDSVWSEKAPKNRYLKSELKIKGKPTLIRTRFARIGTRETGHIAHHSIWSQQAAHDMLDRFDGSDFAYSYKKTRPLRMVESIRRKMHYAEWYEDERVGMTFWDGKRRLLANGDTVPWNDPEEYIQALKQVEMTKKTLSK